MSGPFLAVVFAPRGRLQDRPGPAGAPRSLLGKPVARLILDTAATLKPGKIFFVSADDGDENRALSLPAGVFPVKTGKNQAAPAAVFFSLKGDLERHRGKDILVLDGRYPLLSPGSLRSLLNRQKREKNALTRMTGGPGVREVDLGAYVFRVKDLLEALEAAGGRKRKVSSLPALARTVARGTKKAGLFKCPRPEEALSVDTDRNAARAMRVLRDRKIRELEAGGVIVLDPASTWIDLDVRIGRGTVLYPSVVIEGNSSLGKACRVYPFVHLVNTRAGHRVKILSSTMIEDSVLEHDAQAGPFTHFRPKTVLRSRARVGNFVEMKNTDFGRRSKAGHLSYLGDTLVEEGVNVGAGTITCNYDGIKKSQTVIERGAFIGSGAELIAPVRIGRGSYIGAGSTITEDVSPGALAVARGRQVEKPGWARRRLKKRG
jgi:bifunctional UDP-N-acetylglucosamine pyrophosphorylase/glucosamine-1-phosphate N-acetyltransferase